MEISVRDLWNVLKKSVIFMVIGAILFGVAFWGYTSFAVQKVYRSSAKYILVPQEIEIGSEDVSDMNNDLVVGAKYIPTIREYLMNAKTMEGVLRFVEEYQAQDPSYQLSRKYTTGQLLSLFSFSAPSEDEVIAVFTVSCNAYSPTDAKILLDAFGNIINERAGKLLRGMFYVETCMEPGAGGMISPNVTRNTMLGVVLGAVLPYVAVLVYTLLDTRIKAESDVKNRFKYPVLGQIPRF